MTKQSKIHKFEDRTYRYNYEESLLEWVHGKEVVTSIGLSKEEWEDGAAYWIERWHMDLEEELFYLMQEFR